MKVNNIAVEGIQTPTRRDGSGSKQKVARLQDTKSLKNDVDTVNKFLSSQGIRIGIKVDKKSEVVILNVYDAKSNLIKSVPPEEFVRMVAAIKTFFQTYLGLVLDEFA
mgnify:CR=1 FL=1